MVAPPLDPQLIHHFLASASYADDSKWLIHHHLLGLVSAYPSLLVKLAPFTRSDGRTALLLQADGTIPMPFHGVSYNIPVVIWLLESYPRHPPCVYVNPTRDMIIKRPHPHVSPSGFVSVPFLQNWTCPSSNLVDLVRELSVIFSRDPPLYSQRRPPADPPPVLIDHGLVGPTRPSHPQPPRPYSSRPCGDRAEYLQQKAEDAAEVFRRDAVDKIMEKVAGDLAEMRKERAAEAEGLLIAQATLRRGEEEIDKGLKEMNDEKDALEQQLQVVLMNADVLEAWLKENDGKKVNSIDVEAEKAFECVDSLSKQMLECAASDLAIDDMIFSMDKAVREGVTAFDHYLKNVRLLCREQFFHRATAAKVRARQLQAQVATMAAKLQL